jgi:hypothetical protein
VSRQCIDTSYGPLCLDITNKDCFEITATVTLESIPLYGPTSVPIADILTQIQNRDPNSGNLICFLLTKSSILGTCSLCGTVDSLNISGNSLHYCGSGKINCTSSISPPLSQPFDIPCIDFNNCELLNCRNECSNKGRCTSFGMCECYPGYYGYDCSLQINGNCASSPLLDSTCWEISYPQCDTVDLLITSVSGTSLNHYPLKDFTSFSIVPYETVIDEPSIKCDMCLTMENIHSEGSDLVGCPTINMQCNSIPARSDLLDCITIAPSPDTSSCTENDSPQQPPPSNFSSQIFFGLGLMLVILVLLSLGYLVIKKFGAFGKATPEVYEDEEPLNESDY